MAHTRAAVLAYPSPEILRIEHSQANPLKLSLAWDPAEEMPSGLTLRAEIHPSRSVADDATPLAAVTLAITDADTQPWTLEFSSQQTNLDLGGRDQKTFVLTISGIETSTRFYTLADADLVLFRHPCSQLVPPAVSPLLYATTEDIDALDARLTVVEETGGGGGVTNLSRTLAPTSVTILSDTGTAAVIPAADGTNAGVFPAALHTKLAGIATGATANATDAQLRDRGTHTGTQAIATIVNLQTSLDGKADLVGGKLNTSQLPDLAVTQYLGTAANQSAMLVLMGQRGDWCIRTDDGKVYIVTGEPSSTLGNWTSMSYPTAPVLSVAGRTGSVTLSSGDISGLGALATLSSVGTAQITDGAVTQVKLWSGFVNGTKALPSWSARDNQPPATAFATIDTRNGQYVLDFDDGAAGANERAVFAGIIPAEFSLTGGFKVRVHWWASSINTAHRVKWTAEVDRRNTDASTDSGAWGSLHSALGPPDGTQFKPTFTEITLTSIDGLVAGEPFRLRISRDSADSANDTMIGDAELFGVQIIGN